jgi:putative sterol carrier protein
MTNTNDLSTNNQNTNDQNTNDLNTALEYLRNKLTPDTLETLQTVITFHFKDTGEDFTLDARDRNAQGWIAGTPAAHSLEQKFKATLTQDDFAALVLGKLHPMAGMVTGRMKLEGNMREALVLDKLLK